MPPNRMARTDCEVLRERAGQQVDVLKKRMTDLIARVTAFVIA